jgi:hypothetical protein
MWTFTTNGLLSSVQNTEDGMESTLLVRARRHAVLKDLAKLTNQVISRTPNADYPYRLVIEKSVYGAWLSEQAQEIDYPNFKAKVSKVSYAYSRALAVIWAVMRAEEDENSRLNFIEPVDPNREVLGVSYLAFSTEDESLEAIQGECLIDDFDSERDHFSEFDEWRLTPLYERPTH